jgi:membrane protein involved in colicin uptake
MKTIIISFIIASSALADQWDEMQRQQEIARARQQESSDRWKAEREQQEAYRERQQAENDRLRQEERLRKLEDNKPRDRKW